MMHILPEGEEAEDVAVLHP